MSELFLRGELVSIRPIELEDCTPAYLSWLQDPQVNLYLETRWSEQTMERIREFVAYMIQDIGSHLFAMIENSSGRHIGNIKLGPINKHHKNAEISYFIGEKSCWGKGYASEAIRLVTRLAFERFDIDYISAGVYGTNTGSIKALKNAGYTEQGRLIKKFIGPNGREDHLWLGILRS